MPPDADLKRHEPGPSSREEKASEDAVKSHGGVLIVAMFLLALWVLCGHPIPAGDRHYEQVKPLLKELVPNRDVSPDRDDAYVAALFHVIHTGEDEVTIVLVPEGVNLGDRLDLDVLLDVRIGGREEILNRLVELFPGIDAREPEWAVLEGEGFSVEFQLGEEDEEGKLSPISALVHDWDEGHVKALAKVCEAFKWRAFSMSDGDWIDFNRELAARPAACPKCGRNMGAAAGRCTYCGWTPAS